MVAAVTRSATTHELLLQTLGLFLTLFPVYSVCGDLSFHAGSRTYVAHPFLKSPSYPPPRLSTIIYFRPLSRLNGREIATVLRELGSLVRGSFTMVDFQRNMLRWLWIPTNFSCFHLINYLFYVIIHNLWITKEIWETILDFPFLYARQHLLNVSILYNGKILDFFLYWVYKSSKSLYHKCWYEPTYF